MGRDGKAFEQEVLPELVTMSEGKATNPEEKKLIPKIRMLYAQAYTAMVAAMDSFANPKPVDERLVMNPGTVGCERLL